MNFVYRVAKVLLQVWSVVYEGFLGPRTLVEITPARVNLEAMTATSVEGVTTTIHCQERSYQCRFHRWFVRDRIVHSYFVFATVQGTATAYHLDACRMERSFPKLLHPWMPSASQKEAAIEAYLDLLLERLQRNREGPSTSFVQVVRSTPP